MNAADAAPTPHLPDTLDEMLAEGEGAIAWMIAAEDCPSLVEWLSMRHQEFTDRFLQLIRDDGSLYQERARYASELSARFRIALVGTGIAIATRETGGKK